MEVAETNRDRVRRVLFDQLAFRFPKAVDPAEAAAQLNSIADDLGYMTDVSLAALRDVLRSKGTGSARNFWPDLPTFYAYAEAVQYRPLDQLPDLLSWFGSVEGPRAVEDGTLVATYRWIERRKEPPRVPRSKALRREVKELAEGYDRRLRMYAERVADGRPISAEEVRFKDWYDRLHAKCLRIVSDQREARGFDRVA